jgi:catechol 2,3-dioxygenase-like lactoylglutathione lyase family enzyme
MDVEVAFTGVAVSDLEAGRDFYERFFGKPPDVLVNEIEVMWGVNESAWLYIVVDPARAGHALAALSVADLDAALAELASRGLKPSKLEEHEGGARKAVFFDPDGNTAALIGVPTDSRERVQRLHARE